MPLRSPIQLTVGGVFDVERWFLASLASDRAAAVPD